MALLSVLVIASSAVAPGLALAQGSLHLPPMPEQKAEPKAAEPAPAAPASKPAPPPAKPASGQAAWPIDSPSQIRAIQVLLHDLGLYSSTTNGTLGPLTRAAIREFQRGNNEPQTGEPSEQLFNELQQKKAR